MRVVTHRNAVVDGDYLARSRFEAGGISGLLAGALQVIADLRARASIVHVAWDHPAGSENRKSLSAAYKAGRPPAPPDYVRGKQQLYQLLRHCGVVQHSSAEGEGDDVIATLVSTLPGSILIWSIDKDLIQLVRPGVDYLRTLRGGDVLITNENCEEVTGLPPERWLDYQCLVGDSCDGVAGVPGVGDVGARLLLGEDPLFLQKLRRQECDLSLLSDKARRVAERAIAGATDIDRELLSLHQVPLDTTEPTDSMAAALAIVREFDVDSILLERLTNET